MLLKKHLAGSEKQRQRVRQRVLLMH